MTSTANWKRRSLYLLCIVAVFGVIVVGLYYSAHHVPEFYREALADTNVTAASAEEFQAQTAELLERMEESSEWTESFTEQQINSWLAYEFPELEQDWVPAEVSQPRVRFQEGTILTACRYEGERFSGVLSFEIRPRITEAHELALELMSVKAGSLPIPLHQILEEILEESDLNGLSLKVVEIDGRETLLISNASDHQRTHELTTIAVEDGQITLSGRSHSDEPLRVSRLIDQSEAASEFSN